MRRFGLRVGSWLLLGVPLCIGCGGSADDAPAPTGETSSSTAAEDGTAIKRVEASKLPPLGNPLPPLDQGRVTNLSPPKGWEPLPRDSKHLAKFAINKTNPNDLPRILVTVEDSADFTDDVTADNVVQFAEQRAGDASKKFVEPPKALIIGDNAYARYVTQAKKASRTVERQVLETVFDGRRYAITLEVFSEQLLKNRDLAYAVAAGVQFTASGAAATESPAPMPEETKTE